jgi:hypothetical protein
LRISIGCLFVKADISEARRLAAIIDVHVPVIYELVPAEFGIDKIETWMGYIHVPFWPNADKVV